jgi:CheY-like chemotaxis protein
MPMQDLPPLRVIYADDDESVRNLIGSFLLDQGVDIHTCSNANDALKLVESVEPNVVVLDLVMPGMDGYQAARHIRDRDRHGRVRLIALTGVESPDTLERAARAGFDEFLKKPVSGRTLLGALGKGVADPVAD